MKERKIYVPWHLVFIFIFLSICIGIGGHYFFESQKEDIKMEKQNELSAIADLKVEQIVNWRKDRMADAEAIYANPFMLKSVKIWLENGMPRQSGDEILQWMDSLKKLYQYHSILLIDSKRNVRLSLPVESGKIGKHANELFSEAISSHKVIFSDLHTAEHIKDIHLDFVIPLHAKKGNNNTFLGVFLIRIDPYMFLFPLIQTWPTPGQTAETLLVRREGSEVVFLNELRHKKGTALTLRFSLSEEKLPAAMAAQGKEGVVEGIDYRGAPVLAALRSIPDSPWFLIAKIDQEEIYKPVNRRAWFIGIIVGISILASALGVGLVWRHQRAGFYRREYELELQQEELLRRYEYLSRYANDIILLLDHDFKIIEANERAVEAYGYTYDELLRLELNDLRSPETQSVFSSQMKKVRELNGMVFETLHKHKDGTSFPVEASSRIVEIKGKEFYQCIIRDISERKEAEDALRDSEEKLRTVIEAGIDAIIAVNDKGDTVLFNPAAEELFQYSSGEVLNRPVNILLRESAAETHQRRLENFFSKGVGKCGHIGKRSEQTFRRKDGTLFDAEVAMAGGRASHKRLIVVSIHDITARKQAENILRESQRQLSTLIGNLPGMVYRCAFDRDWSMEYISVGCIELTGYQPEDFIGNKTLAFNDIIHPDHRTYLYEKWTEIISHKKVFTEEYRIITKDGTEKWVWEQGCGVYSEKGDAIFLEGFITDITERKLLASQLLQAQKMESVGRLAGGIAHDFNNILTAIMGFASLLLMKMREDDPLRRNVTQIIASSERAAGLTNSLLAFSRKQIISLKPVNLNELVRRASKFLLKLIGEDIELKTALADEDLVVMADGNQIEQVLMNLATNARDAMPDGGLLMIETELIEIDEEYKKTHGYGEPGAYALISAADTGSGIDEKTRAKIFEPFFTTKETGKGTGLGLSIVYGIIKQHQGYINVYSEKGRGTTFKIYLPLSENKVKEITPPLEPSLNIIGTETLLLAEDDADVRKFTKYVLEESGYTVIEAEGGMDAIDKFMENKDKVRLLLLDVIMPKKNGKEVFDDIRKLKPEIKALFMSGYTANVIHKKGILEEGLDFILKPVSPAKLLKKVREVLDRPKENSGAEDA